VKNVKPVDFVRGRTFGDKIVHRDFHDYKGYLYVVCDEGPASLQILDLQYLPDSVSLVYDDGILFNRSHNIFIDSSQARLYVFSARGDSSGFHAMSVFDIQNPLNPKWIFNWDGAGHVHDGFVRNDTAYLNCGYDGLFILDLADINNVKTIATLDFYPDQGYNHSGWLNAKGDVYVFADETHGMQIKVADVSSAVNIGIESLFGSGVDTNSIPHNIIIKDNLAYVSYYHDGLYIFDISNPKQAKTVGYYDTYLLPDHDRYRGAWGVYPLLPSGHILISDMQSGLFVFQFDNPVGIETISVNRQMKIFPNPAEDNINFEIPADLQRNPLLIRIFDLQGMEINGYKSVVSDNTCSIQIPLSLPGGLYIVHAGNDKGFFIGRFLKL
jgi:choice-of-anchor B domain-containing protein